MDHRFESTSTYIAGEDLAVAVNAAVALQRPLLVKGEPGTGKTVLAEEIAQSVGLPLITWNVKSTTKAAQGLYEYDAVARLRDSQLGSDGARCQPHRPASSGRPSRRGCGPADRRDRQGGHRVPERSAAELDRMEFHVYETVSQGGGDQRRHRVERDEPDAFLRRCFFHYINFPDGATMASIVRAHFPELHKDLLNEALGMFFGVRDVPGLKKRPSTSELLDWIRLLVIEHVTPEMLEERAEKSEVPPFMGSLVKNEQDMDRLAQWVGSRGWSR